MAIKLTWSASGLFEAVVTPPHVARAWTTPEPMQALQLVKTLSELGCHQQDIGDAFYEADPNWLSTANNIRPTEVLITGGTIQERGSPVADPIWMRIEDLVKAHLTKIVSDASGWATLYRDPDDQRLWELTYPQSELHGGGAPQLRHLDINEVQQKYGCLDQVTIAKPIL